MPTAKRSRPVFHAALGEELREARESKGWSVQQVVNFAHANGDTAVTWNKVTLIEAGRVQFPDADVLRGLARLYALAYADIVSRLVSAEYGLSVVGSDLTGHKDGVNSAPHTHHGGAGDSSRSLIPRPGIELSDYATAVDDVTKRLLDIAAALREHRAPILIATSRRRGDKRARPRHA